MLEGRILSTMIFIFAIIFTIALILVIKDNIINEKKGLNPQIAMVVGLSVLSIAILEATGYWTWYWIIKLFGMAIDKIDTISHMSKLIMYFVSIVIAVAMCIYCAMKADEISDKNNEIDHQQSEAEETKSDVVESIPEETTDM